MEHSEYCHFVSRAHEGVDIVIRHVEDHNYVGCVGTLKTRYPHVQVPGQDKRRDMQITRSRV
jgi:hypothetical protein